MISFTGRVVLALGATLTLCGSIVRTQGYPAGTFLAGLGAGMCLGVVIVWIDARQRSQRAGWSR